MVKKKTNNKTVSHKKTGSLNVLTGLVEPESENLPGWIIWLVFGIIIFLLCGYMLFGSLVAQGFQGNWVKW